MNQIRETRIGARLTALDAEHVRQLMPFVVLIVLVILVGLVTPEFLAPQTLIVLAADTATLFVMGAGVTFAIMLGGIDLSIEAVASFVSVVVALALPQFGYFAFLIGIAVGIGAGLLNGLVHVRLLLPSFIVTLAAAGVWTGIGLLISNATSVPISAADRALTTWVTADTLGIPNELFIAALVLAFALFIQHYTPFGRYSRAIGSGEAATWASGVNVPMNKIIALAISSGLAGLAGVMLACRLSSGGPRIADQFLLPAIATVVVGGTSISGGVGSVWRTVLGALIITVIRTGMNFVGVDAFAQQIVFGIVLIIAVGMTIDRSKMPIIK
ncbi:MAG: ABC transporter permease [Chloroflexi bacterium]|nr:ABC transporter permease [Chloroflexota bacterium]